MNGLMRDETLILTQITFFPDEKTVYKNGHVLVFCHDLSNVKKVKAPNGDTVCELTFASLNMEVMHVIETPEKWLACRIKSLEHLASLKGDKMMQKNVIQMRPKPPVAQPVKDTVEFEDEDSPEFTTHVGNI